MSLVVPTATSVWSLINTTESPEHAATVAKSTERAATRTDGNLLHIFGAG